MNDSVRICKFCGEEIVMIHGEWWNNKGNNDYPMQCLSPKAEEDGRMGKHEPKPKDITVLHPTPKAPSLIEETLTSAVEQIVRMTMESCNMLLEMYIKQTGLLPSQIELVQRKEEDKIIFSCRPKENILPSEPTPVKLEPVDSNEVLIQLFYEETAPRIKEQLIADGRRYGTTWQHRPREGQEDRIFARFNDYYDKWKNAGVPIPWEMIIGNAHIAMVREAHPELLIAKDEK